MKQNKSKERKVKVGPIGVVRKLNIVRARKKKENNDDHKLETHSDQNDDAMNCREPSTIHDENHHIRASIYDSILLNTSIVVLTLTLGVYVIPSHQASQASYPEIAVLMLLGAAFHSFAFRSLLLLSNTARGRKQCRRLRLKRHDVYDICVKAVSALQAVLACVFAWLVLLEDCCRGPFNFEAHSRNIEFYTWFGLPYFIYDIVVMYKAFSLEHPRSTPSTFVLANKTLFFHHIYIPTVGFLGVQALRRRFGDCAVSFLYSMEFSTIFVNIRLIMHRLRSTSNIWYLLNGILMLVSFFVYRICMIPHLIVSYSKMFNVTLIEAVSTIPTEAVVSISVFMALQVYWMALMIRVAGRLVRQNVPGLFSRWRLWCNHFIARLYHN